MIWIEVKKCRQRSHELTIHGKGYGEFMQRSNAVKTAEFAHALLSDLVDAGIITEEITIKIEEDDHAGTRAEP